MSTASKAPQIILDLVARFDEHRDTYRRGDYNETLLRNDFLGPFFEALGWDVNNRQGHAEAYREVIHEDALRVEKTVKAPDYCFRIGPARKFFVEAKKPSVDIKQDTGPAFQLRRYAWTAKLPLSILTDFEEFAVYDCRIKPDKNDKASLARVLYFKYTDYVARWHEIAGIFSREAILRGSFDKFAESNKKKRGTAQVDDAFLEEIEAWRESLAKNLSLRNASLTDRQLNFSVQAIIDRVIFLRMCEGRGIEPYGRLQSLLNGPPAYPRLVELFHRADEKYNSGLFHFQAEKDREPPDELTVSLAIDDKPLKDILARLYYPESPYEFAALPAEILGQVYEQFLGKVIRLTEGHRAKVEEKPEVRKAGGVYYTPTYIVDYIVRNTVGKLVEGKSPQEVAGLSDAWKPTKTRRSLTVLDPACGSGSFLIVAYQYLLDWYLNQYIQHDKPENHSRGADPRIYQRGANDWRLTTAERKRILLSHIYGVDIDYQAVEVTKLSLLLKVLEGETEETLERQLFHKQRALPDLAGNIKCGNSLIGPDFYQGQQMSLLDEEEKLRINVFDWQKEFPEIFPLAPGESPGDRRAGFDAVIGNPPYLYSAGSEYIDYFRPRYALSQYQTDFYVYFIEKVLMLVRPHGFTSMIVTDSWLNSDYFSKLRQYLLKKMRIERIAIFNYPVFEGVTIENSIFVVERDGSPDSIQIDRFRQPQECSIDNRIDPAEALTKDLIDPHYNPKTESIVRKMDQRGTILANVFEANRGIHAYRTDGYGQSRFTKGPMTERDKNERSYHSSERKDDRYLEQVCGKHVFRFHFESSEDYVLYGPWLAEPREPRFFMGRKIALRKILGHRLSGTFLPEPTILDQSLYVVIDRPSRKYDLRFALGILLSAVGAWYLRVKHSIYDKLYPWYTKKQLDSFPIATIDFESKSAARDHNHMVDLVQQMLDLHNRSGEVKTDHEKTALQRQIDATDQQIDQLVYQLYGLTDDEIRLVEESTS